MLLPGNGSLTRPLKIWILPSCPLWSLQAPEFPLTGALRRILLESSIAELSLDSNFSTVLAVSIPRVKGKYTVRQAEPLYLVRLNTTGKYPGVP